jgi:hypothetical protein
MHQRYRIAALLNGEVQIRGLESWQRRVEPGATPQQARHKHEVTSTVQIADAAAHFHSQEPSGRKEDSV